MTVGPASPFTLKSALLRTVSHIVLRLVLEDSAKLRQGISQLVLTRKTSIHSKREIKTTPLLRNIAVTFTIVPFVFFFQPGFKKFFYKFI